MIETSFCGKKKYDINDFLQPLMSSRVVHVLLSLQNDLTVFFFILRHKKGNIL